MYWQISWTHLHDRNDTQFSECHIYIMNIILCFNLISEPLEVDDWGDDDDGDEDIIEGDDNEDGVEAIDPLHIDDDLADMTRETSNYSQVRLYFYCCCCYH